MRCEYFQARFSSSEWGGEVAIPDDTPGGGAAAELVLRYCYDFDALVEARAEGGVGLPALVVAADFFGCAELRGLASDAFSAVLEGADVEDAAALLEQVCADEGVRLALERAGEASGGRSAIQACRETLAERLADPCKDRLDRLKIRADAVAALQRLGHAECVAVLSCEALAGTDGAEASARIVTAILSPELAADMPLGALADLLELLKLESIVVGTADEELPPLKLAELTIAIVCRPDLAANSTKTRKRRRSSGDAARKEEVLCKAIQMLAFGMEFFFGDEEPFNLLGERLPVRLLDAVLEGSGLKARELATCRVDLLTLCMQREQASERASVLDVLLCAKRTQNVFVDLRQPYMDKLCALIELVVVQSAKAGVGEKLCALVDWDKVSHATIERALDAAVLPPALIARKLLARREALSSQLTVTQSTVRRLKNELDTAETQLGAYKRLYEAEKSRNLTDRSQRFYPAAQPQSTRERAAAILAARAARR